MEQEAYETIFSQLEKPQKASNSILAEISDIGKFSKYMETKDLKPKVWNNILTNVHQIHSESVFDNLSKYLLSSEFEKKNRQDKGAKSWIQVYNTIATHYLQKANISSDKTEKDKNLQIVTQAIGRSDRIDVLDSSLFVLKGFFYFYQGSFNDAIMYFKNAIEHHPTKRPVTVLIGQACVEFTQKKYDQALKHLTQAAKMNPKIIPKLKFALGYSCFNTKKFDQARRIFQSILQKNGKNGQANLGLAMISKNKKDYENYFKYLLTSFNESKQNLQVLLELAEHYMYKEEFERALKLATNGISLLEARDKKDQKFKLSEKSSNELKSRFNYVLGHINHYQKNNKEALKCFSKSIETFPNNFEAQFGLGQIYLADRNWKHSLSRFEHIVKYCKKVEAGECFKILGYLYSKVKNKELACTYYEKALAFDPNDYECMLEYASMLETINPSQSLEIYLNSLKVMEKINSNADDDNFKEKQQKIFIHPEILLNVAVLKHKLGKLEESREDLLSLQDTVKEYFRYTQNERYQALIQIINFNLGCVLEDEGDLIGSRDIFRELVVANPLNIDAFMKLSNIHLTFGDLDKAREISTLLTEKITILSQSLGADKMKTKLTEVLCFQGYIDYKTGKPEAAMKTISSIRDKCQYEDPYGKLLQASINYDQSVRSRQDKDQHKKILKVVTHDAKSVLKSDEGNYFAAMTLGITLAESLHFSKAWNTFSLMLESCEQEDIFLLNSAILALIMRRFETATAILINYLENNATTYEALPEVLLGLALMKEKNFQQVKCVYQRLVLKYPGNLSYRFNLCSVYLEEAYEIIHQEYRQFYQTEQALNHLKIVQPMLKSLKAAAEQNLESEPANVDEKLSQTYKSELKKMIEFATKKLGWISTKIPVFEKVYEQEKENLRLRKVIREEKHAQRGRQISSETDERKLEQKALQMRDNLQQFSDELRRHKEERKMRQEMRKAGVKMPKMPKAPKIPKAQKESNEEEEPPKPKRLPKKFHLRYFLMGDENKKKKKSKEDREDSDATSMDEEEAEEMEDELEEPKSEEAIDENLDFEQDEELADTEGKASSKKSRLTKLKKKGNGNLNKMIRNFMYKGSDMGIKGKKKRKLNSGRESVSNSNDDKDDYEDQEEDEEEETNGFIEGANTFIEEENEDDEDQFNEDMYLQGKRQFGNEDDVFMSNDES